MRVPRTACRALYLRRSRPVDAASGDNPLCPHGTRHSTRTKTLSQSIANATQMRTHIARGCDMRCCLLLRIFRCRRWVLISLAADNRWYRQHGHTTGGQESLPCFHRHRLRCTLRLRRNHRLAPSHRYFRRSGYRRTLRRSDHSKGQCENPALCHTHNRSCPDHRLFLVPSIVGIPDQREKLGDRNQNSLPGINACCLKSRKRIARLPRKGKRLDVRCRRKRRASVARRPPKPRLTPATESGLKSN